MFEISKNVFVILLYIYQYVFILFHYLMTVFFPLMM
jgi:hypothetical protein